MCFLKKILKAELGPGISYYYWLYLCLTTICNTVLFYFLFNEFTVILQEVDVSL